MTAPARFRQSDVTRAIRAAKNAGERLAGCVIDINGNIVLTFGNAKQVAGAKSSWDDLLDGR